MDFEKAFDSIHYGIPQEIVSTIQSFYNNFNCRVGNSQHRFPVLSGVRQGCVMSALLFNITIDWVMRQTTQDKNRGIRWKLFTNLNDLDFADDLALLSHTHSHIQEKTNRLHIKQVGLKINKRKTEVMTLNVQDPAPITKSRGISLAIHRPIHIIILVALLDTTEEQEASSSTELVRPGMPSGCLAPCGNHNNTRHTQN